MTIRRFTARSAMPAVARDVFAWHAREGALERLLPPWERVEVAERQGGIRDGGRVRLRLRAGPFTVEWLAVHGAFEEGRSFVDEQASGPFARWVHTHRFEEAGEGSSVLEDSIEYGLPLGPVGDLAGRRLVESRLRRMFAYRHEVTRADLERHRAVSPGRTMRIAVSGASGLLGRSLDAFLSAGGHEVHRIVRRGNPGPREIPWDPRGGFLDAERLEGMDAVVHLAGENIASGRWNAARKAAILESRAAGTRLVAETLAALTTPPRVFLGASAVGYYGDRGDERLDESAASGRGFLAEVCRQWEAAALPAARRGIRVAHLRFGVVLSAAGGALARMLPAFRFGAGGPVGSGRQFVSWISREDAIGAVHFALCREEISGAVNVASPEPVPGAALAKTLGRVLGRPAVARLPAGAVRLVLGEMGSELLLASQRVEPRRLLDAGFPFRQADLETALRFELGRGPRWPRAC